LALAFAFALAFCCGVREVWAPAADAPEGAMAVAMSRAAIISTTIAKT
jgi:hypothetical protein